MFAPAVFRAIKNGDIHQPQSNEWTGVKNSKEIRLETGWFLASNMFGFQPSMFPSSTSCLGANASKGYCPVFIIGFPSSAVEIPVYRSWVIYVTLLVFGIGHCSSGVGAKLRQLWANALEVVKWQHPSRSSSYWDQNMFETTNIFGCHISST